MWVWPRSYRCCGGRQHTLEASLEAPAGAFELVHAADGFRVHAPPGLPAPEELHFDVDHKGRIHAFWNGQGWIG